MGLFSRRHYRIIAKIFADCQPSSAGLICKMVLVDDFIAMFSGDNDKFDRDKFRVACMVFKNSEENNND